jgi:hypothetical protein
MAKRSFIPDKTYFLDGSFCEPVKRTAKLAVTKLSPYELIKCFAKEVNDDQTTATEQPS